jgi:hypothetical protein
MNKFTWEKIMKRLIIPAVLILICLAGCSPYDITDEFSKTYPASGVNSVEIVNVTGNIKVVETTANEISVYAVKKTRSILGKNELDKISIDVTQGADMKIETNYNEYVVDVGVDYEIRMPATIMQKIKNTTGNVETAGSVDRIELVSGNIKMSGTANSIKLTSGNIEAKLKDNSNSISIENVTGNVEAYFSANIKGSINIDIVTGSCQNHGVNLQAGAFMIYLKTVSGNIDLYNL